MQQTFLLQTFGLFIDLRSLRDNDLQRSGLKLVDTKRVQLKINRNASGSRTVKHHILILSNAQLNIIKRELESIKC